MTAAARARLQARVPLLAVSALSWIALIVRERDPREALCTLAPAQRAPGALAAAAALMFGAMMLPAAAAPLRHVLDRSFARRRLAAGTLFVAGYALPWVAAGVALLALAARIDAARPAAPAFAAAILGIALWQCSPAKQRCLNRSHSHPGLSPFGARAGLDVLRFGATHSLWCIGSCSALMLLPMLFPAIHLPLMAGVTLWLAGEKMAAPHAPAWRLRGPSQLVRIVLGQTRAALHHAPIAGKA